MTKVKNNQVKLKQQQKKDDGNTGGQSARGEKIVIKIKCHTLVIRDVVKKKYR